jgi:rod shape-determining protein MreC
MALELSAWVLKCSSSSVSFLSRSWHDYLDLRQVRQENRRLQGQVVEYQQLIIHYQEKLKATERRRVLDELQGALNLPAVRAKIIGADATLWYNSRIIDQGSAAGITRDCAVLSPEGILGRIVHLSRHSSVMQLITDADSGTGVFLEKSRAQGILRGEGRPSGFVEFIRSSEQVAVGEKVLTSGLDQIYPKGLLAGYVCEVLPTKQIFQQIRVTVAVPIETTEDVLIILKKTGN